MLFCADYLKQNIDHSAQVLPGQKRIFTLPTGNYVYVYLGKGLANLALAHPPFGHNESAPSCRLA